jgi:hypothetical protein
MPKAKRVLSTPRRTALTVRPSTGLIDLESDFHSAVSMAHIAAELLEHNLGHSHKEVTGHPQKYHLDEEDVDVMLFAVYDTHRMLKNLRDKYLDALSLKH